jgi:hypothetical protein
MDHSGETPLDLSSNLNGIPNAQYSSDHLPIFVEFAIGNASSYITIDKRLPFTPTAIEQILSMAQHAVNATNVLVRL